MFAQIKHMVTVSDCPDTSHGQYIYLHLQSSEGPKWWGFRKISNFEEKGGVFNPVPCNGIPKPVGYVTLDEEKKTFSFVEENSDRSLTFSYGSFEPSRPWFNIRNSFDHGEIVSSREYLSRRYNKENKHGVHSE